MDLLKLHSECKSLCLVLFCNYSGRRIPYAIKCINAAACLWLKIFACCCVEVSPSRYQFPDILHAVLPEVSCWADSIAAGSN